jgi:hypothetical protein
LKKAIRAFSIQVMTVPFLRHSRESGNPACTVRRAAPHRYLNLNMRPFGPEVTHWIPAFAGMTGVCRRWISDRAGMTEVRGRLIQKRSNRDERGERNEKFSFTGTCLHAASFRGRRFCFPPCPSWPCPSWPFHSWPIPSFQPFFKEK